MKLKLAGQALLIHTFICLDYRSLNVGDYRAPFLINLAINVINWLVSRYLVSPATMDAPVDWSWLNA